MNNVDSLLGACTGCGACAVICPAEAIAVKENEEGFYTAQIDSNRCANCGKCLAVCLRGGAKEAVHLTDGTMTAAQSSNAATVRACTSGGIAWELTHYALEQGWAVAGAIYDVTANRVKTVVAHTVEEAEAYRGSKYLQSDSTAAFRQLTEEAVTDTEKHFLVFGTPCQIYGLSSLLEQKKLRSRFILVDLFCHGVPSSLVWDTYRDTLHGKTSVLEDVTFRSKSIGWHNFVMHLTGKNGIYHQSSEGDLFYHAFFDNVLFSKACFTCEARQSASRADIRLGDYWGKRYQHREDGVSAVLTLTKRGGDFFAAVPCVNRLEETSVEEMLLSQSVHPYQTLVYREGAIAELRATGNLKKTIQHYRRRFPAKTRLKLSLKEFSSHLPDGIRSWIRYLYKK